MVASFVVAVAAAYAALAMLGRIHASDGHTRRGWWIGGALAMGVGIWSMHFVGMIAFRLPTPLGYDSAITALSLLLAIGAAAHALWLVSREHVTRRHLAAGALVMGLGIAAMHYVGMAALRMQPAIDYRPAWFALSLLIAVAAAGTALAMGYRLRDDSLRPRGRRLMAATVMGAGIVGMHYTGMAAARFPDGAICGAAGAGGLSPDTLALLVVVFNVAVLGTAIGSSALDRLLRDRTAELADSLRAANRQLEQLALHDALTGLPNRRCLVDTIGARITRMPDDGTPRPFALLFVDLDGFKAINDAWGHQAGDLLLMRVAGAISRLLREQDMVARLGGDEFVVLAEVATEADALAVADRILARLAALLRSDGPDEGFVTASIGIARWPADGASAQALITHADAAMYAAKQAGRNGASLFTPQMRQAAQDRAQLAHELRRALDLGQFVLHYQPMHDTASGTVTSLEALVRWNHPRLGQVMPDCFIELAEQLGLIVDLGQWVLDDTCRQWACWHAEGIAPPMLSVNLSLAQLRVDSLPEHVAEAIARHGLPPQALTLEVTESLAVQDPARTGQMLARLHAAGARISVDDFGAGYTSLAHLAELPVQELKIDRLFIQRLGQQRRHAEIVRAVVQLARGLGLDVVAEGVETSEQARWLASIGCTRLQGWHIAPAMPADVFAGWLAKVAVR